MIRDLAAEDPEVSHVGRVVTVHFGPDDVLAQIELAFTPKLEADAVARAIDRIQGRLKPAVPKLKHVFLEPAQELRA